MPDVTGLRKAIQDFSRRAKPGVGNNSPCTGEDLENAVKEMAKVLNAFADKLEEIE